MQSIRPLHLDITDNRRYLEATKLNERPPYYYLCTSQKIYDHIYSILDPTFGTQAAKKYHSKSPLYISIGPQKSVAYLLHVREGKELAALQKVSVYYSCAELTNPLLRINIFVSTELSELFRLEKTQHKFQSEIDVVAVNPSNLRPWKRIIITQDEDSNLNRKHLPSVAYIRIQLLGVAFKNRAKLILRDANGDRIALRMECSAEVNDGNEPSKKDSSATHCYGYVSDKTNISVESSYPDHQTQLIQKNLQTSSLRNASATQVLQRLLALIERCHRERLLLAPRSILLHSPPGTGKSYLVKKLAIQQNWQLVHVTLDKIGFSAGDSTMSTLFGEALQDRGYSDQHVENVYLHKKILFFDDIDMLFSNEEWAFSKYLDQIKAQFILGMQKLIGRNAVIEGGYDNEWWDVEDDRMDDTLVVVIATSSNISSLDKDIRKTFEKELELPPLSSQEQSAYLESLVQGYQGASSQISREKLSQFIERCHGLSFSDLELLFRGAVTATIQHFKNQPSDEIHSNFLEEKLTQAKNIRPKPVDPYLLSIPDPAVASLLGGLSKQLFQLTQSIMWIHMYPQAFARLDVSSPRGILLYGPPGTGKTSLVRNLAIESKINFISASIQELQKPYLGESERAIIDLFNRARQASPCIIFIDEIQAIFRSKSSCDSAYSRSMTSLLLMELDGVLKSKQDVLFIAATNHPDWLDSSLLRPGRLDKHLYIPPPDAEARAEILNLFIKKEVEDQMLSSDCCSEQFIQTLVEKTEGFTGADLKSLIMTSKRKAAMKSKTEKSLDNLPSNLKTNVSKELILNVLSNTAPSVSKEMIQEYLRFQKCHKLNW